MNILREYWRLFLPVIIIVASILLGFIVERKTIKWINRLSQNNQWRGDTIIISSFQHVIIVWFFLGALLLCLDNFGNNFSDFSNYLIFVRKSINAIFIASVTLVVYRLATKFIDFYRNKGSFPVNKIFDKFTQLVIISLGTLSVVNSAGFSGEEIYRFILPFAIVIISIVVGFIIDRKGLSYLHTLATQTAWQGDEIILRALKNIIIFWVVLIGVNIASNIFPIPNALKPLVDQVIIVLFLGSFTFVVYRLAIGFIRLYSGRDNTSATLTSLFENITKIIVFSLGILLILQAIGIGITPLVTAVGVGGVSIGLALKGPLENLASGITIITSKKVRPGDYIQLSTGEEGYVTDVDLKYTVIRKITGNLQVIPNAHLIASSFTNYALPNKKMLVTVDLGVSYDSDLEKVEAVTLEVAKAIIGQEAEAFLVYNRFGYYSINFTVYLEVEDYFEQLQVKHRFIKEIYQRYRHENIIIPFPISTNYGEELEKIDKDNQ